MRIGKRIIYLLLVIVLIISSLIGCGPKKTSVEGKELTTVRAAVMTGTVNQYTAVVGKKQGIFEKNGINLEITEYAAGINTIDAVISGQADIGNMADYAAINRIGNTLDNTNLVIISEIDGGSTKSALYAAPQYENDLQGLNGKGFTNNVGTVSEYYNSKIFQYLGFDESKQKLINSDSVSTSIALAQSGEIAAAFTSGANAAYYEGLGWKKTLDSETLGISTYSYYLVTNSYNESNQELLSKFLKASQESFDYIKANMDETAIYLEGTLGIIGDNFKKDWESIESRIGFSNAGASQLEEIALWAYKNKRYSKEYDIKEFINTDALKLVYPDKVTFTGE